MSDAKSGIAAEIFLERFPRLEDRARRAFTDAIQALQLQCYVLRGGALKVDPRYAFIEKHEDLVDAYLALGGWRLYLDRERGVARLYHPESSGRVRFNKIDTTLILALRLLYHEGKMLVSESPDIVVTVGALREKLTTLLPMSAARSFLGRKLMGTALRKLEKYSVVSFQGSLYQVSDDSKIRLEPVLEHLVTSQSIEEVEVRLKELHSVQRSQEAMGSTDSAESEGDPDLQEIDAEVELDGGI